MPKVEIVFTHTMVSTVPWTWLDPHANDSQDHRLQFSVRRFLLRLYQTSGSCQMMLRLLGWYSDFVSRPAEESETCRRTREVPM